MPRNLVLFDLEWNIGYQPFIFNYHGVQQTLRGEIIEIGAVKIDEDANVLDTFSIHLRPRIFRCLQHHIAKVTGLTQEDLDKGEPLSLIHICCRGSAPCFPADCRGSRPWRHPAAQPR